MSTPAPSPESSPEPKPKRRLQRRYFIAIFAAIAVVALLMYFLNRGMESTDDAFVEAHILQVSPQIAGQVSKVYVDDNQEVKAGDLLVEIDPRDNQAVYDSASANLASAEAKYAQAQAQLSISEAALQQAKFEVENAQANADNTDKELKRSQELRTRGVISQQDLDNADTAQRTAKATLDGRNKRVIAAGAEVTMNQAAVKSGQAQVELAKAMLETARLRLSYNKIYAPQDGRVTRKNVEPGNYVQTGSALMAVVPHDVWVVANYKETQLDHMRNGQPVEIKVDAYPALHLTGRVESIQKGTGARFSLLPSENATGNYVKVVQRVPVKIVFDKLPTDTPILAPGMSVIPVVNTR
ncbi:membrane fusion protein, multidrug efflux system [Terrimicrobium sacchariphilum]|jgi:membrane fusion protein (multidrug efflux system)|uniref:Membrane fusion protein, multidrug efflux system n=1 Tax=Terrimicrobium sacchariphilum TaxID=690879 RepID=A0A146G3E1_TERSA|nr:HlyD family secretion protein [Terrimicrobium sacchariphilum]GAT31574.1 membrane fusion protein, multidrug efflux system [Terrimicrobium sacchariphilum]